MFARSRRLHFVAFPIVAAATGVMAQEDQVEPEKAGFEGYSRSAEVAIERWIDALERLESYADEGEVKTRMEGVAIDGPGQKQSTVFEPPRRFHVVSMMQEVISDGKELTIFRKGNRRYKTEPLKEDMAEQLRNAGMMGFGLGNFQMHELLLTKDKRSHVAEKFKDLDVTGSATIDNEKCIIMEGRCKGFFMGPSSTETAVKLYMREKDRMLRRVEYISAPPEKTDESDKDDQQTRIVRSIGHVYDLNNIRINEKVDSSQFEFKPPRGVKKIDRFYNEWFRESSGPQQFALSGKPAPAFDLPTTDGHRVTLHDLRGKAVVVYFMHAMPRGVPGSLFGEGKDPTLEALDALRNELAGQDVTFLAIYPEDNADKLLERMKEDGQKLPVALDADRDAASSFLEQSWATGVVLIGKDGVVQGWIPPSYKHGEYEASLRENVEKLLASESLESGKPMNEDELKELHEQTNSFYAGDAAEPLNEERLHEVWSVSTRQSMSMHFAGGGREVQADGLWIRTGNILKEIDAAGKMTEEIKIPRGEGDFFGGWEQFAIGRFRGRRAVVWIRPVRPEGVSEGRFQQPKSVQVAASNAEGNDLWNIELSVSDFQMPQCLVLADLDGAGGDEVIFAHQAAVWIVSDRGETLVRFPISGWISWLRAEDLDRDGRAELYVRTQHKLARYDYRPGH